MVPRELIPRPYRIDKGVVFFFLLKEYMIITVLLLMNENIKKEREMKMSHALVLQSDFGVSDGAVSAMYGVANSVNRSIRTFDLTHDIPQYNIWEASYRLLQTVAYWPADTVFVSVVDPGVGTDRRSIAVKTSSNQFIITPDNGTLTHVKKEMGIAEARIIDETMNRLPHSGASHTFHGRDIYAYTGARLASNIISFEQIGPKVPVESIVEFPFLNAKMYKGIIAGTIDILDVRFGNIWTNINRPLFEKLELCYGESVEVMIKMKGKIVYKGILPYTRSFADCRVGEALLFVNSLDNMAIAINQESFSDKYQIGTGVNWQISIGKSSSMIFN